jgi:hypothetical protein
MVWISLILSSVIANAQVLPGLLTKHAPETLRFITMDGRFAYVTKAAGVLGVVSGFRSTDFITDNSASGFIVTGSRFKQRVAIEIVPNFHTEMGLYKNHKIVVVPMGDSKVTEIGSGKNAKLHLQDEWITFFDPVKKAIHLQNVLTRKKFDISLSKKANPFFIPEVEMVNSSTVVYTDVNEIGLSALISYNLVSQKSSIVYKATQTGTRLEVCQNEGYLSFGEFPYEGVTRGAKIMHLSVLPSAGVNLAGYTTLYSSVDQDLGNMLCLKDSVYFIKTIGQDPVLQTKTTEVARVDLKSAKLTFKTSMGNVTQIINMDDRILIPHRGEFLVLEGTSNLGVDTLQSRPLKGDVEE